MSISFVLKGSWGKRRGIKDIYKTTWKWYSKEAGCESFPKILSFCKNMYSFSKNENLLGESKAWKNGVQIKTGNYWVIR